MRRAYSRILRVQKRSLSGPRHDDDSGRVVVALELAQLAERLFRIARAVVVAQALDATPRSALADRPLAAALLRAVAVDAEVPGFVTDARGAVVVARAAYAGVALWVAYGVGAATVLVAHAAYAATEVGVTLRRRA